MRFDVIVVGGGPAGAGAATHLARDGFSVLLLDRAAFPRDKPCGEFFSPPVRGLLDRLGVYQAVRQAGIQAISEAALHCYGGPTLTGAFTRHPHPWSPAGGFSIERRILDNLLWQNAASAGVDARHNVAVRGLLRNPNGRIIGVRTDARDFLASLVIGADGGRSRVARELGVVRPLRHLQKIALVSHYAGVAPGPARVEMFVAGGESLVCGYGAGPGGTANVTLVVPEGKGRKIAAVGAEAYADGLLAEAFPQVAERLRGATRTRILTCGTFGHTTRTPVGDGCLLVGDAAAFIDPFTGEGVYFALRGAELAAEAAGRALRHRDVSARALAGYARARRRELLPKYAVCAGVEWAVHNPGLMRRVLPILARRPQILERILEVTGDMARPEELLWSVVRGQYGKCHSVLTTDH